MGELEVRPEMDFEAKIASRRERKEPTFTYRALHPLRLVTSYQ
ncbi:MAG TPA: hypothetical protein VL403_06785 [Candidatus Kryptonia bacterium]|nr:hypothetical protein [Candidatus Kryptonia bacterium]